MYECAKYRDSATKRSQNPDFEGQYRQFNRNDFYSEGQQMPEGADFLVSANISIAAAGDRSSDQDDLSREGDVWGMVPATDREAVLLSAKTISKAR